MSVKPRLFPKVFVCEWQFGHMNFKFSFWQSSGSPFTWSTWSLSSCPLHIWPLTGHPSPSHLYSLPLSISALLSRNALSLLFFSQNQNQRPMFLIWTSFVTLSTICWLPKKMTYIYLKIRYMLFYPILCATALSQSELADYLSIRSWWFAYRLKQFFCIFCTHIIHYGRVEQNATNRIYLFWCRRQDSNLYAIKTWEPKPHAPANYATAALMAVTGFYRSTFRLKTKTSRQCLSFPMWSIATDSHCWYRWRESNPHAFRASIFEIDVYAFPPQRYFLHTLHIVPILNLRLFASCTLYTCTPFFFSLNFFQQMSSADYCN